MLSARQQTILFELIGVYVETGEPVSSAQIAQRGALSVSSATIRNVLSDLEGYGLVRQPHTSAGRVPTPVGLRMYVDALRYDGPVRRDPVADQIEQRLGALSAEDLETAVRTVGSVLSHAVRMASIVSMPGVMSVTLQDLHLSALSERRVLAVLVTSDEQVYHRVVQMEHDLDRVQLQRIQAYLSGLILGLTLEQVRARVRRELVALEQEWSEWLSCALEIGMQAAEVARPVVYVEGKLNVFDYAGLVSDVDRLRHVLEVLEEKEQVLEVLDGLMGHKEPTVLIGPELELDLGDDLSLIVCSYEGLGERRGVLGLLGPSRMDYARMVPLMHRAAHLFSARLTRVTGERG